MPVLRCPAIASSSVSPPRRRRLISLGFGLAHGALLDAFLVRIVLMPGLMHLLGRSAWWLPRWLDRVIPDVDVEGARLERTHPPHHVGERED